MFIDMDSCDLLQTAEINSRATFNVREIHSCVYSSSFAPAKALSTFSINAYQLWRIYHFIRWCILHFIGKRIDNPKITITTIKVLVVWYDLNNLIVLMFISILDHIFLHYNNNKMFHQFIFLRKNFLRLCFHFK